MKLTCAVITLLVSVSYAIAEGCVKKEADGCIKAMTEVLADGQPKAMCRALKNTRDCYQRIIEKCVDDPKSKILEGRMSEVEENVKSACKRANMTHTAIDDEALTEDESGKCIIRARLAPFISECTQKAWKESRGNISFGIQPSDIGCNFFMTNARCVSHKVGNLCGDSHEEPFYHQMILSWKGLNKRVSKSDVCADAKKAAEEYFEKNSRKRRSLPSLFFAKFMP